MSKPKISFCLPTYNRNEWVGETIASLMDQTEKDIEIIVIDDCSNDGSRELLEWAEKSDSRVRVFYSPENRGAGKSRNLAIKMAKADIVAMCDSDDFYPEDHAANIVRWFDDNKDSELVNFPYVRVDYFGDVMEPFKGGPFDHDAFKKDGSVSYFCNPTVAFKKDSAIAMGGYGAEKEGMTDDIQFVKAWVDSGRKIDFDERAFGVCHRVLPTSMMAKQRGFREEWAVKS